MEAEEIRNILIFSRAEKELASRFDIPVEAFIPLFFSIRFGGDWCYGAEAVKAITVMKKTSVYDDKKKLGYSLEEIYLFVNPLLTESEGVIHRLEKCGSENTRMLVERPYRVRIYADLILKAEINPLSREISTQKLTENELEFEGSAAYGAAHEIEHLDQKETTARSLWELRFV